MAGCAGIEFGYGERWFCGVINKYNNFFGGDDDAGVEPIVGIRRWCDGFFIDAVLFGAKSLPVKVWNAHVLYGVDAAFVILCAEVEGAKVYGVVGVGVYGVEGYAYKAVLEFVFTA